jgi:hypothetical protein
MKVRTLTSAKSLKPKCASRNYSRDRLLPSSWKVGKYWDNSGTQNPIIQKSPSESRLNSGRLAQNPPHSSNWPIRSFDVNSNNKSPEKPFTSNSESTKAWEPTYPKISRINYQNRDYNLITHTVNNRPEETTTSRQKGLGSVIDSARPYKKELNGDYQEILKSNPKVFYRQSGVFTMHQDNCVRLSGFGPFHRALS